MTLSVSRHASHWLRLGLFVWMGLCSAGCTWLLLWWCATPLEVGTVVVWELCCLGSACRGMREQQKRLHLTCRLPARRQMGRPTDIDHSGACLIELQEQRGACRQTYEKGSIEQVAMLGVWLIFLVWRTPEGRRRSMTLAFDNMHAEEWRRLRVMLRQAVV